jgi:hypothetical protein
MTMHPLGMHFHTTNGIASIFVIDITAFIIISSHVFLGHKIKNKFVQTIYYKVIQQEMLGMG